MNETNTQRQPIRILHVFGALNLGGAESRVMDLFRRMDRTRVQFDFLVHTGEKGYFEEEARELGAEIYRVPRFTGSNLRAYRAALTDLFEVYRGRWRMTHGHMTSTAAIYLPIAKTCGGCITIAHARSAGVDPGLKGVATKALRLPLQKETLCDYRFAVSKEAAYSVFGKKLTESGSVRIEPNAIDLDAFVYNADDGLRAREELGIAQDAVVIGHVGRFHYAKNHDYLLRVFAEIKTLLSSAGDRQSDVKLLLIGEGELLQETKKLAATLGLTKDVVFAGVKTPVAPYDQAMDLFLFPSRYEGLPGTLVEAQASGLRCLISNAITTETDVAQCVTRLDIKRPPAQWAKMALSLLRDEGRADRRARSVAARNELREKGFDARAQAEKMAAFYCDAQASDNANDGG